MTDPIARNVRVHDRGIATYRQRHPEIYNAREQARLRAALAGALARLETGTPSVLDFGTGAGNLADHLAELGSRVAVADVSPRSVATVGDRLGLPPEDRYVLNGRDLEGLPSGAFDLLAAYSVLHHIPDYLAAVRDMARVLRPGGILYLDHEAAPAFWAPGPELLGYRRELAGLQRAARGGTAGRILRLLSPQWWWRKARTTFQPKYQPDGDIHVWPDDHVEWNRVESATGDAGLDRVECTDYLLCRGDGPFAALHARYADRAADMRLMLFRKR